MSVATPNASAVGIYVKVPSGETAGWLANNFLSPSTDEAAKADAASTGGAAPAPSPGADPLDVRLVRLEQLARLSASGVLTEAEVASAKAEILSDR